MYERVVPTCEGWCWMASCTCMHPMFHPAVWSCNPHTHYTVCIHVCWTWVLFVYNVLTPLDSCDSLPLWLEAQELKREDSSLLKLLVLDDLISEKRCKSLHLRGNLGESFSECSEMSLALTQATAVCFIHASIRFSHWKMVTRQHRCLAGSPSSPEMYMNY